VLGAGEAATGYAGTSRQHRSSWMHRGLSAVMACLPAAGACRRWTRGATCRIRWRSGAP